ncbi:hypothetical protein HYH02_007085 [Chlamydomonas schloesseri]|uniref:Uncharacterized protein n=1 Tax=Chlamydomonas schloesseri TaxID=2026947 RepID=A0A836B5K5_9CHLO|nr:hypothetical protein HYH02_007085 [Chlamydomonas schloesseri]|eukprot:KAG2448058.1 hypothetical protein HYH02_007085 [Chlamydomonas schloesseri]
MAGRKQQLRSRRKAPMGGGNTMQSQRVQIHINNAAAPRRPANTRSMQRGLLLGPMGLRGLPYMAAPSTTIINQMPSDAFNARFATDTLLQGLQSEVRALKSENMGLHDHIDQAWGQVAAAFKPPYTTASYPSDTSTAYGAGGSSSSGGSSGGGRPPAPPRRAPSVQMQDADSASAVPMPAMPPMLMAPPQPVAPPPALQVPPIAYPGAGARVIMAPPPPVTGPEVSMSGSSSAGVKIEPSSRRRTAITIDESTSAISSRGSNNMTQAVRRRGATAAAATAQSTQDTVGSTIAPRPTIKSEPPSEGPPPGPVYPPPSAGGQGGGAAAAQPDDSSFASAGSQPSVNSPAPNRRALAEYSRQFLALTKELD